MGKITIERETLEQIQDVIRQHANSIQGDDFGEIKKVENALRAALAAQPAPAAVPPDGMDTVAIKYAHKMALDLECILAEYGGSWYNTAMQTLGEYRSEMNAIHERECPTFMDEPVIAAAGDKP